MANLPRPQSPQRPSGAILPDLADMGLEGEEWLPPSNLAAPDPRPGMGQRWVATDDGSRYAKALREGWTPRKIETADPDFHAPTLKHGDFAGVIGIQGMVLMEMPLSKIESRRRYFDGKTQLQFQAIEQDLHKINDRRMPLSVQNKTSTSTTPVRRTPPKSNSLVQED